MDDVIFQIQHRQNGTTEQKVKAAKLRKQTTPTTWYRLCDYFVSLNDPDIRFLWLASQRVTNLPVSELAKYLKRDVQEVALDVAGSEKFLARDARFARNFSEFLSNFGEHLCELRAAGEDQATDSREQAEEVGDRVAATLQEIAEEMGLSYQRAQQLYNTAMRKFKKRMLADDAARAAFKAAL